MKKVLALCSFIISSAILAQESPVESVESLFKVDYDTPLTLDLEEEQPEDLEPVAQKKKKVKKNVFFGIKTKKGFVRTTFGREVVYEMFHVLKEPVTPAEYAQDFYWMDYKKKKVVNSTKVNPKFGAVLHGPYRKMLGDKLLESGYYYMGMKHKRWVRFNKYDILQEKKYWWKGWPEESLLSYYDFEKTKLREVIPVHYGERNGEYWAFHEDGSIAVRGEYKFNHKVGTWREYYGTRRPKREVKYPKDPFDFEYTPYITREWNPKGTVIFDYEKYFKTR